jgi:hypothetical protein
MRPLPIPARTIMYRIEGGLVRTALEEIDDA